MARLLTRGRLSKLHILANSWENLGDAFLDTTGSIDIGAYPMLLPFGVAEYAGARVDA